MHFIMPAKLRRVCLINVGQLFRAQKLSRWGELLLASPHFLQVQNLLHACLNYLLSAETWAVVLEKTKNKTLLPHRRKWKLSFFLKCSSNNFAEGGFLQDVMLSPQSQISPLFKGCSFHSSPTQAHERPLCCLTQHSGITNLLSLDVFGKLRWWTKAFFSWNINLLHLMTNQILFLLEWELDLSRCRIGSAVLARSPYTFALGLYS